MIDYITVINKAKQDKYTDPEEHGGSNDIIQIIDDIPDPDLMNITPAEYLKAYAEAQALEEMKQRRLTGDRETLLSDLTKQLYREHIDEINNIWRE